MPVVEGSEGYRPMFTNLSGRGVVYDDPPGFGGRAWPAKVHTRGDFAGVGEILVTMNRLDRLTLAEPGITPSVKSKIELKTEPLRLTIPIQMQPSAFYSVLQPPATKYIEFIRTLVGVVNGSRCDALTASVKSMAALEEYLLGDQVSYIAGVFKPIIDLSIAARETLGGSRPTILFDRRNKQPRGRPTDIHEYKVRALLAVALYVLVRSGYSRDEAVAKIAKIAGEYGLVTSTVKTKDSIAIPYTKETLLQIYIKVGDGTGADKLQEAYRFFKIELHQKIEQAVKSRAAALEWAKELVKAHRISSAVFRRGDD